MPSTRYAIVALAAVACTSTTAPATTTTTAPTTTAAPEFTDVDTDAITATCGGATGFTPDAAIISIDPTDQACADLVAALLVDFGFDGQDAYTATTEGRTVGPWQLDVKPSGAGRFLVQLTRA